MSIDGSHIEIEIERLASGGEGIGHFGGKVCFVPLSAPGDCLEVRIVQDKKRFYRGEIVQIASPGPSRRESPCSLFGQCGGCSWLHLDGDAQAAAKQAILAHTLGIHDIPLNKSPHAMAYRSLARLHGVPKQATRPPMLGFTHQKDTAVVDLKQCPVLEKSLSDCLIPLRDQLLDAIEKRCEVRLVNCLGGPVGVIHSKHAVSERLYNKARSLVPHDMQGMFVDAAGICTQVAGPAHMEIEGPDGRPFSISPSSFGQTNRDINRMIANLTAKWISSLNLRTAVELFAGASNYTVTLAQYMGAYTASELDAQACEKAEQNLSYRDMDHVRVKRGDALRIYEEIGKNAELIVMNPPRRGHFPLANAIAAGRNKALLYISCNPATLARDLEPMKSGGFEIQEAAGFDMFPQTPHMETAVLMVR